MVWIYGRQRVRFYFTCSISISEIIRILSFLAFIKTHPLHMQCRRTPQYRFAQMNRVQLRNQITSVIMILSTIRLEFDRETVLTRAIQIIYLWYHPRSRLLTPSYVIGIEKSTTPDVGSTGECFSHQT